MIEREENLIIRNNRYNGNKLVYNDMIKIWITFGQKKTQFYLGFNKFKFIYAIHTGLDLLIKINQNVISNVLKIIHFAGGGCVLVNQLKSGISQSDNQDLYNFFNKFYFYVEKICTKAVVAADSSESQEIMIALQWFIFQEENIYNLNKNAQSVVKSYDLILKGIKKLLKSCLICIRTDSFKCLYILQITASLSKVIFSFHVLNEKRFMKCDLQQEFLDISDELRQQMQIEKNDLIQNEMEVYLFLTKTSFEISPNNGKEKEKILQGCLYGQTRNCLNHYFREPVLFKNCMRQATIENNLKFIFKLICCNGKQLVILRMINFNIQMKFFYRLSKYMIRCKKFKFMVISLSLGVNDWKNHILLSTYNQKEIISADKFFQLWIKSRLNLE
ncbi:unnamed protein product [Paramecium octaurelia]|uniref:Uncharacterized protein n=1 Tax=Paramecium octaurelia TaxID=43137 RepID=A0A8S1XCY7_PAROT|nr:unnamed protein product [Paramecium octaurelia]